MKKRGVLIVGALMGCFLLCHSTFAAQKDTWEQVAQEELLEMESTLLPQEVNFSNNKNTVARGRYIASSGVSITTEGYGVLGVYADTLAHVAVKKIKMTIYLDQWDEDSEDWVQIDSKSLTYEYEEGGEDLNEASQSFLIENLETNKYYRLRGLHAVWSFDGYLETHATMTDGVLLTDGPA